MKHNQAYDIKVFLGVSGLFLAFFLLTMAEIFAFEDYKPSTLFNSPDQTSPVVASAQEEKKNYQVEPLKVRVYFTTESLMVDSCKATVPLEKTVYPELNPIRDRLMALFQGPTEYEKSIGYTTRFEGWQQVFMGTILQEDGTLIVRFSEEVLDKKSDFYLGKFDNRCGRGVWDQIYLTAKEDDRVKHVIFSINDNASLWNELVAKRECPPKLKDNESTNNYIQAQKQCAKPETPEKAEEGEE
jgi:spore germination protein GerM